MGRRVRRRMWLEIDWAWVVLIAFLGIAFPTLPAWGASITYTVDPTQSLLTLSGSFNGQAFQGEGTSGLTASYSGTITADRDFGQNNIQLIGGNIAAENSGMFVSLPSETAPADYEFETSGSGGIESENSLFSVSSFSFSLSSGPIISPISFDTSELSATIDSGELYSGEIIYSSFAGVAPMGYFNPPSSITGNLAFASASGSLADTGNVETLDIPVNTDLVVNIGGSPLTLQLSGTIVATSTIPEPASLALLAPAVFFMFRRGPGFEISDCHPDCHPDS
jgi:hypothetical protein